MIASVKLIPDLQHTVMSVLDILNANNLIQYGMLFKLVTLRN